MTSVRHAGSTSTSMYQKTRHIQPSDTKRWVLDRGSLHVNSALQSNPNFAPVTRWWYNTCLLFIQCFVGTLVHWLLGALLILVSIAFLVISCTESRVRCWLGDWMVLVSTAYTACLLIILILVRGHVISDTSHVVSDKRGSLVQRLTNPKVH